MQDSRSLGISGVVGGGFDFITAFLSKHKNPVILRSEIMSNTGLRGRFRFSPYISSVGLAAFFHDWQSCGQEERVAELITLCHYSGL